MRRVMIIGCPGSGKSTFARALSEKTGLPLRYLDMMNWNADRTTVPEAVFLERLHAAMAQEEWIIDGNYGSTIELRLQACDTAFFLDYPPEVCLEGVAARRGTARPDMPWVENGVDEEFLDFIRNYNAVNRPKVLGLLAKYADRNIVVLHTREEAAEFLKTLN